MNYAQIETLAKYLKVVESTKEIGDLKNTQLCLTYGILVDPLEPISKETADALIKLYGVDLRNANATFYETFEVRKGLSWEEVVFDRLCHYAMTYGGLKEFFGTDFIPNSEEKAFQTALNTHLTTIELKSYMEVREDLEKFLNQPLALPTSDISILADLVEHYGVDITEKANKELQIEFGYRYKCAPKNPELLVRLLVRILLGTTDYYKNAMTFSHLRYEIQYLSKDKKDLIVSLVKDFVSKQGLQPLADHFRPNKQLWLTLRKLGLQREVNAMKRLSEVSRKDHTFKNLLKEFPDDLSGITNYQLIRYYNYLSELVVLVEGDYQVYRIRNGKTYVKAIKQTPISGLKNNLVELYLIRIREELKYRFADKKLKFYQPEEHISIALPTTAKSFIGSYPMYTRIEVPEKYQIGIYWSQQGDLDLHAHSLDGRHTGFYSENIKGITYTGDMTCLNRQGLAAEGMLIEGVQGLTFSMNPYNTRFESDACKIYISESLDKKATSVVADGSLLFQANVGVDREMVFAANLEGAVVLTNLSVGGRIPNESASEKLTLAVERKSQTALSLRDFAEFVGAEFVDSVEDATHDFSQQGVSVATFTDLLG